MKLHVTDGAPRDGYIHINPNSRVELDSFVDDAEATEILFDCGWKMPSGLFTGSIQTLHKKLALGGKFIVTAPDAYVIAHAFAFHKIDASAYGDYLNNAGCAIQMSNVEEVMSQVLRLRVMRKKYDGLNFYIEGVRQ